MGRCLQSLGGSATPWAWVSHCISGPSVPLFVKQGVGISCLSAQFWYCGLYSTPPRPRTLNLFWSVSYWGHIAKKGKVLAIIPVGRETPVYKILNSKPLILFIFVSLEQNRSSINACEMICATHLKTKTPTRPSLTCSSIQKDTEYPPV